MEYEQIFKAFEYNANAERARSMCAYMRGRFPYLGILTPKRRELSKAFLSAAKNGKSADWAFIRACWSRNEREFQYLAVDYLDAIKEFLTPADIDPIREIAVDKAWWDTIAV
jgi:3-methyladenine DNA glycosylase AlkD